MGILAGIGPAAGAFLFSQLIKECQRRGCVADSDFPEVVLLSLRPRGTSKTGVVDEGAVKGELARGLSFLNSMPLDAVIVACNTVHKYFDWMQSRSAARIVNMVARAQEMAGPNPGILCSRTTREAGLYRGLLPTEAEQTTIDEVIWRAMGGVAGIREAVAIESIIHNLRGRGAGKVIVGCTELSMLIRRSDLVVDAGYEAIKDALQ